MMTADERRTDELIRRRHLLRDERLRESRKIVFIDLRINDIRTKSTNVSEITFYTALSHNLYNGCSAAMFSINAAISGRKS
jgi:hypothetical protein